LRHIAVKSYFYRLSEIEERLWRAQSFLSKVEKGWPARKDMPFILPIIPDVWGYWDARKGNRPGNIGYLI
jgi:hypothetical protein